MRSLLLPFILLLSVTSIAQSLTTIKVSVPDSTNVVYITGNQEALGNWQPQKIQMHRSSAFERELIIPLVFPAVFKFSRGSWDSEGITTNFYDNANCRIEAYKDTVHYRIRGWTDKVTTGDFQFPFTVLKTDSPVFKQQRTIAVALPKNYDAHKKYPVIYALDAFTLFEPVVLNTGLLSKQTVTDDGTADEDGSIPQVIVVGIFHNNRAYETSPNLGDGKTEEHYFLEGSEKLKEYLFTELIPFVNSNYSTAGYNCIVGHSNTGHFVMNLPFQDHNPFQGIVALSVNGESKFFRERITGLVKGTGTTIFMGYGNQDMGFKELAQSIETGLANKDIQNENVEVQGFIATHTQLPCQAITPGIKFLFKDYNNVSDFKAAIAKQGFKLSDFLTSCLERNRKYGLDAEITLPNILTFMEIAVEAKDITTFRQLVHYSETDIKLQVQKNVIVYFAKEIGDDATADRYIDLILKSGDAFDMDLVYYNLTTTFLDYYLVKKKHPREGVEFLKKVIDKTSKFKPELSFFIAKIRVDNNIDSKDTPKLLTYCDKNFRDNKYFTREEIAALQKKYKARKR